MPMFGAPQGAGMFGGGQGGGINPLIMAILAGGSKALQPQGGPGVPMPGGGGAPQGGMPTGPGGPMMPPPPQLAQGGGMRPGMGMSQQPPATMPSTGLATDMAALGGGGAMNPVQSMMQGMRGLANGGQQGQGDQAHMMNNNMLDMLHSSMPGGMGVGNPFGGGIDSTTNPTQVGGGMMGNDPNYLMKLLAQLRSGGMPNQGNGP